EEEDEEEDEEEESKIPQAPVRPTYGEDRTVYSNEVTSDGKWVYGQYSLKAPVFTNYYNGYSSALSMTFDDGYDYNTGHYVNSIFKQYGFKGTAMLGPCFLNENAISEWKKVLAEGYLDVGCHGYDHIEPTSLAQSGYEHEIKDAIEFLRTNFPDQRVLTFATPYAHINDSYEAYLDDFVISNRLELGGDFAGVNTDFNMYRVKSYSFNKSAAIDSFNDSIKNKLKQNGAWVVELIHCVLDSPYNSTDLSKENFANHCSYINENFKNTVWVASFEEVSIYLSQVKNAKINYVDADYESMTINVTCDLNKDIYNIPMTAKLQVPFTINSAYAVIDGVEYDLEVTKGSGVNSIIVKDIPVNGENVKIYFGGNDACDNGCAHIYQYTENVAATCSSRGYVIATCAICNHSYKSGYIKQKSHVLSDEKVVEKVPTLEENGLTTIKCINCDYKKEIVTALENIAPKALMDLTDGINEWVDASSIVDDNLETWWTNGTNNPELTFTFNNAYVDHVAITINRFPDEWIENGSNQKFTVSIYDGTQWTELDSWDEQSETSDDSPITVNFDIGKEIMGVKFYFDETSTGCTTIREATVVAIIEK
ncbi:MAG: polysaccharide deacetylase family protein, partial [Clostridia bacterium]|nr:polysaccharide deacetylase family protein [Clostridia bacterium]